MIARRSTALLPLALALATFGATSAEARPARGANEAISAAAPTPIDGVYRVTQTAAELAAVNPTEVNPYTYGEGTLVFDRGWVRLTQKSDAPASSWASGTFALRGGNILVMTWVAAGGLPTGGRIKPVDIHRLRWSLYRDQLTFTGVPVGDGAPYCVKPWRRIADAPSATFKTPASALRGAWSNGRRLLVLREGRFTLGKKAAAKPGNVYAVLGDAIRFRTSDGEFWDYTWSIERGLLKLRHPPGNSRYPFWRGELTRKRWHRVQS
jgi:hypothetical protein